MKGVFMQRLSTKYYDDAFKRKIVKKWLEVGNLAELGRRYKVPYDTLSTWKQSNWWPEVVKQYRESADLKLASKMEAVVEQAVEQIKERVESGEQILDSKTGQVISVPVKTRDLTQAVKTLSDRQDVLIGRQKKEEISSSTINDKLALLATQFERFASKQKKPDIVEGELVDAVHD